MAGSKPPHAFRGNPSGTPSAVVRWDDNQERAGDACESVASGGEEPFGEADHIGHNALGVRFQHVASVHGKRMRG